MLDGATIDDTGLMSNGTLKWKTTTTEDRYSKGEDQANKTLDKAWETATEGETGSTTMLEAADYNYTSYYQSDYLYVSTAPDGTSFFNSDQSDLEDEVWPHMKENTTDPEKKEAVVLADDWEKTGENKYSKGDEQDKSLDEAWGSATMGSTGSSYLELAAGYTFDEYDNTDVYIWTAPNGARFISDSQTDANDKAWAYMKKNTTDPTTRKTIVISAGWTIDPSTNYSDLQNPDENSKLGLSLKSGDDYVGATKAIDLTNKNFSLANVQFYNSTTGDVIEDESTPTLSCKPGVYDLMGILTKKGDKTIISGPVADNSDES